MAYSIFAHDTQETVPVPGMDGQSMTFRKLTGKEIEVAEAEHMRNFVGHRSPRGFSVAIRRLIGGTGTIDDAAKAMSDPLSLYDRTSIVRSGLVAWTFPKPTTPTVVDGVLVDAIGDLDDETLEFAALAILKLTKPALFLAPDELETARKND